MEKDNSEQKDSSHHHHHHQKEQKKDNNVVHVCINFPSSSELDKLMFSSTIDFVF